MQPAHVRSSWPLPQHRERSVTHHTASESLEETRPRLYRTDLSVVWLVQHGVAREGNRPLREAPRRLAIVNCSVRAPASQTAAFPGHLSPSLPVHVVMSSGFGRVRASLANCRGLGVHERTQRRSVWPRRHRRSSGGCSCLTGSSRRAPISTTPVRVPYTGPTAATAAPS